MTPKPRQDEDTIRFPISPERPDAIVTASFPRGVLRQAREILDMVAPVAADGARAYRAGEPWLVGDEPSLLAIADLPKRTRDALAEEYATASAAARPDIAFALHTHCSFALLDLSSSVLDAQEGLPPVGLTSRVPAAQVANALVFRLVLDAVYGPDVPNPNRENVLAGALLVHERGTYPDTAALEDMDTRSRFLTFYPSSDYLDAEDDERERAAACVLVGALSQTTGIPVDIAWREEPVDGVCAFARGHIYEPARYVEAVRLHQSFDPEKLRPMIGDDPFGP